MSYQYTRAREYNDAIHDDPPTYNVGHPHEPMTLQERLMTDLGKGCQIQCSGTEMVIVFEEELTSGEETIMDAAIAAQKAVDDWPYVEPTPEPTDVHIHGFVDRTGYNVYFKGFHFEIPEDTDLEMNITYEDFMVLEGIDFKVSDNASWKDYINIELVHPVAGVLVTFAESVYMHPGRSFTCVCPDAKDYPAGVIFRITYVSDPDRTGTVMFNCEPRTRTTPDT